MSKYNNKKLNSEHSNDKYIVIGVAVALVLVGILSIWLVSSSSNPSDNNNATSTPLASTTISTTSTTTGVNPVPGDLAAVSLAKCLAQKQITMYGAKWCSHCQDQKDAFGSAFQYVPYVECPDNVQLCISKKVESYPTWMMPNGIKTEGFLPLPKLAEWAGCPI